MGRKNDGKFAQWKVSPLQLVVYDSRNSYLFTEPEQTANVWNMATDKRYQTMIKAERERTERSFSTNRTFPDGP